MTAETQMKKAYGVSISFILIFAILAAGIMAAGYFSYRGFEKRYRTEVERQLSAIADLKVAELLQWRSERLGDASIIYRNATFFKLAQRYFKNPQDSETEQQMREWIDQYPEHYDYDQVCLLDPQGVTRMSSPPNRPPASVAVLKGVAEVLQSGQITVVDLYRHDQDQQIYLSVLVPIFDGSAGNRIIGIVSLRVDPKKFLYPFILRWPIPSQTAETLLVRHEENEVLFLNELRFKKDAALKLRIPLNKTDVPAVKAALGQTGIVEGLDYRGEQVIADVRAVPDSPWFLVTRMDTSEVIAPAKRQLWMIIGFVTALLFGAGSALAFIWRQQSMGFYLEQYRQAEALRASEERLALALKAAGQGIYDLDLITGETIVTPEYALMLGYDPEEFHETNAKWIERLHPADRDDVAAIYSAYVHGEIPEYKVEFRQQTKDGNWKWLLSLGKIMERDAEGKPIRMVGTHTDISERKQAELDLLEANYNLITIMNSLDALVYIADMETYDLIFVNNYGRGFFGDISGKKCWQVLQQGQEGPCEFCTNDKLIGPDGSPTGIYQWEFRNTVNGQWYDCRDRAIRWIDGKLKRLEIATNITERKQAEDLIRQSLKEKEVLLKEIHHRVKNNMQVIYSLLNLQARGIADKKVRAMFEDARNRVRSMAMIHEKLYRSADLAQIDFKGYLKDLVHGIASTYKRYDVNVLVEMESLALDVNVGIPCGLIVNELVSNCLKYAFPDGRKGNVRVGISKNPEGDYVLTVTDNGVGFPAEMDFRNTSSLGLQLVNVLTGQIHGTIELSRSGGTTFSITFPAKSTYIGEQNG